MTRGGSLLLVLGCSVMGAVLLGLVPVVAGRLLQLPWIPFEGPIRLLQMLETYLSWWMFAAIGLIAGVILGLALRTQTVAVSLDDREIVVTEGSKRARFARAEVRRVLVEGNRLILRDERDVDLLDQKTEGTADQLTGALRRHGWPVGV